MQAKQVRTGTPLCGRGFLQIDFSVTARFQFQRVECLCEPNRPTVEMTPSEFLAFFPLLTPFLFAEPFALSVLPQPQP